MGYIYISYSRQNSDVAQRLVDSLQAGGYTVWVDSEDLKPGAQWGEQISAAITDAEVVITLLSPATVGNRTILNEIELALAHRKPIIPVLIEGATILPSLVNRQVVEVADDWDHFIERLTNAIDASTASLHMRRKAALPAAPPVPIAVAGASRSSIRPVVMIGLVLVIIVVVIILLLTQSNDVPISDRNPVAAAMTSTSISAQNATTAAQINLTQEAASTITSTVTPTGTAQPSVTPTSTALAALDLTATMQAMPPSNQQTAAVNAAAQTATALASELESTETVAITSTPDSGVSTQLPETGGGDPAIATEIAYAIQSTVVAFRATEGSQLSPAEAAQMMILTTGNTNLMFAIGVLSALALGSSLATLYVIWTGSDMRRIRRRSAHPSAHHSGALPAQPDSMPTETMLEDYQIFVSSSEKDKAWVQLLVEDLESLGYAVWWYAKDAPGLPFGNEIRSAIYHTKVFLITLSPDSMKSKHIEEEIRWAEIYDRPIIPVECRPTSIEERFYGLAKGADIDFTDEHNYKAALEFLTQAVDRHLQQRLERMRMAAPDNQ